VLLLSIMTLCICVCVRVCVFARLCIRRGLPAHSRIAEKELVHTCVCVFPIKHGCAFIIAKHVCESVHVCVCLLCDSERKFCILFFLYGHAGLAYTSLLCSFSLTGTPV
jgi:hypothetical protein